MERPKNIHSSCIDRYMHIVQVHFKVKKILVCVKLLVCVSMYGCMLIYGFSGESSQSKQNTGYIQIYTLSKVSLFGLVDNFAINFL